MICIVSFVSKDNDFFYLGHTLDMGSFMTGMQPPACQETNYHQPTVSYGALPMCCSTWSSKIFGLVR